jgi:transposase
MDASKAAPAKKQGGRVSKADVAIGMIRKLYVIEDKIKNLDSEHKRAARQQLSMPLLDELKSWLEQNIGKVPKDSLTCKAMQYTLNQWELLIRYCEEEAMLARQQCRHLQNRG